MGTRPAAAEPELRPVFRHRGITWEQIRLRELVRGDLFSLGTPDGPTLLAIGDATVDDTGLWSIEAE